MEKEKQCLPGIEFEGPFGIFWQNDEVPFETLIKAIVEIWAELHRRGYKDEVILEATKAESVRMS